jgi:hypothetical protein
VIKGLFNLVLIGLIFLSSVAYTLYKLEDPNFLAEQARKVNLYGRISNQFDNFMPEDFNFVFSLTKEETKSILTYAVDGQTFYDFLGKYLTVNVDWLTGKTNDYNFTYDVTAIKNRARDRSTEIAITRYNNLPLCQANQLRTWNATTAFPVCRLSNTASTTQSDVENMLSTQINTFFTSTNEQGQPIITDTMKLTQPSSELSSWKNSVSTITKGMYITWLITLGFLILYLLVLRRRAFWPLAIIFLIVGLLQIGFSFIAWGWLARALADAFTGTSAASMSSVIADAIGVTMEVLKTIMGSLSIYTLGIGGIMLILAIFFAVKKPKVLPV